MALSYCFMFVSIGGMGPVRLGSKLKRRLRVRTPLTRRPAARLDRLSEARRRSADLEVFRTSNDDAAKLASLKYLGIG